MNLKKYYSALLKKAKDRDDLTVEKYSLHYRRRSFAFYKFKSRYIGPADRVLMIMAGLHGDEISGPITIQKRLNDIVDYAHRRDVKLIIYPLANPSGFQAGSRYNIDGEKLNGDFIRYELENGEVTDDLKKGAEFKKWFWSSDPRLKIKLPLETDLAQKLIRKDPLKNVAGFIDLHQDHITENIGPAAYQYAYGDLGRYGAIIDKIKEQVPLAAGLAIGAGQDGAVKSDKNGFIVRYDGSLGDLFWRLKISHSVTVESTGATQLKQAVKVNMAWIYGLIDLIRRESDQNAPDIQSRAVIIPNRIHSNSKVNLIHTSSPVLASQQKSLEKSVALVKTMYPRLKVFDVSKNELDPRHLSASEKERLTKFRRAARKVDWLQPIYGGTGAVDMVRRLGEKDLKALKKNRPVVSGFSDTTTLINFLYFKLKLLTFHYSNFLGIAENANSREFFDLIEGKKTELSYQRQAYRWLGDKPQDKIEGVAIGGNLSTFRDFVEICKINVRSWKPFILFIEDVELDVEDLHRLVIALDNRGIFQKIRAIVLGRFDNVTVSRDYKKFNFMFGRNVKEDDPDHVFNYLLSREMEKRREEGDPLYILKVDNLGHGIKKDNMIIPIGARTLLHKNGRIEFKGPFVR